MGAAAPAASGPGMRWDRAEGIGTGSGAAPGAGEAFPEPQAAAAIEPLPPNPWFAWTDWFLPADFEASRRNLVRARLLVLVSPLFALGSLAIALVVGIFMGGASPPYYGLVALAAVEGMVLSLPFLMRYGAPLSWLTSLLVGGVMLHGCMVWFLSGGYPAELLTLAPIGLLLASLTLNLRAGIAVGVAMVALLLAMEALRTGGHLPPPLLPADLLGLVAALRTLLIAVGAILILAGIADIDDRLERLHVLAREAADGAIRARSAFLTRAGQDLGLPAAGVMEGIGRLEKSPLSRQQRRLLAGIRSAAEAQSAVLDDLAHLSRLQAGEIRLRPQPTDLRKLLDEILAQYRSPAAARGLVLEGSLDPDLPQFCLLDRAAVRLILGNLIANAMAATARGSIVLSARQHFPKQGLAGQGCAGQGRFLVLTVRDTGHGFPPAENPMRQANADAAAVAAGPLPGLPACIRLCAAMDGRIVAFGQPGAGASFRVTLPLEPLRPEPSPTEPPRPPRDKAPGVGGRPLHILVVEDSASNRALVEAVLQRHGHRLTLYADGAEALAAIRRAGSGGADMNGSWPDLLILDIQLPGLSGTEVARAVRAMAEPIRSIPILGITADATPEHRHGYLASGLDELHYKPVDWPVLTAAIDRLAQARMDSKS